MQDSAFFFRPVTWSRSRGIKVKQHVTAIHLVGRKDLHFSIKRNICFSVGACVYRQKVNHLEIVVFKGKAQCYESKSEANGSRVCKNSIKLTHITKEIGESMIESPEPHSTRVYSSEANGRIAGSPTICKLLKKWLNMLCPQSRSQSMNETWCDGQPPSEESPQTEHTATNKGEGRILKAVWCHFLELDATIKIPMLMFIPLFLAVNVIYKTEVSKELTPLWILGPLIVAFCIKILRALFALCDFCYLQTVKVAKILTSYYLVAHRCIAKKRLKEDVLVPFINSDCKELSREKMGEFKEWFIDKYLDVIEFNWYYYFRVVRFLKRIKWI